MTLPAAATSGQTTVVEQPRAASFVFETLKKRADFLRAARGPRVATPGFIVQMRKSDCDGLRVGFTCSKKVGNAVERNRAKRRLREIARDILPRHGRKGHDYVLIGRAGETATRPLDAMACDLARALDRLHRTQ